MEISNLLKEEQKLTPITITLLLLGSGESGKSTILKQFRILHTGGFKESECETYAQDLRINVLQAMGILCKAAAKVESVVDADVKSEIAFFSLLNEYETRLTPELATRLDALWKSAILQQMYDKRSTLQLQSNAKYLLDAATRIASPDYVPTDADILCSRVRTTGVVELNFVLGNMKFTVLDLGGQRSERRKWHLFFEGISAVLYVVALDDYDTKLYEDETINRMDDAMNLFVQTCKMKVFHGTTIILFLNKKDLFKKKIARVDLSKFYPDFQGAADYKEGCKYMENKFMERVQDSGARVYTHFTCAISTKNIKHVFDDVRTTILIGNLTTSGLAI